MSWVSLEGQVVGLGLRVDVGESGSRPGVGEDGVSPFPQRKPVDTSTPSRVSQGGVVPALKFRVVMVTVPVVPSLWSRLRLSNSGRRVGQNLISESRRRVNLNQRG